MNKTTASRMEDIGERNRKCLLGKINADINSRLPEKPEELNGWEKYKLIREGKAVVKKSISMKKMLRNSSYDQQTLVDSFTYPERQEVSEYARAHEAIQGELHTREIALDKAIDRLVDEVCAEIIDHKTFLDVMEDLASREW